MLEFFHMDRKGVSDRIQFPDCRWNGNESRQKNDWRQREGDKELISKRTKESSNHDGWSENKGSTHLIYPFQGGIRVVFASMAYHSFERPFLRFAG